MRWWFKEYSSEQHLLLALPYLSDVWRASGEPAQKAIKQLQQQLSSSVNVHCLDYHNIAYNDIWLRDTLPLWFKQASSSGWQGILPAFDGWGGIQHQINADQTLAQRLFDYPISAACWCGEGGMFSHNGEWLLVGMACLKQRNPGMTEAHLKNLITNNFSPLKPIFVDTRLSADETGGHIDNMALFIDDDTLLFCTTDDPNHPDYQACRKLEKALDQLPDSINKVALPLPYPQSATVAERRGLACITGALQRTTAVKLLCSYVNVVAIGNIIVLPHYQIDYDAVALHCLQQALPGKTIVSAAAREFVLGGGGLHCISHSVPAAVAQSVIADGHVL